MAMNDTPKPAKRCKYGAAFRTVFAALGRAKPLDPSRGAGAKPGPETPP